MAVLRVLLIVVVIALALPFVIGMTLPSTYEASAVLESKRTPDEVWSALTTFEKNPVTGAAMKRFERLPDVEGRPAWNEVMGETRIRVEVAELTPPARLVLRMADAQVPVSARVEIGVQPMAPGSRITAHWVTEVRGGSWISPLFRLAMKIAKGAESSARGYLDRLAANLGEAKPGR
jgi:uncharacterized protein YndB with AHSA1/START domain